MDTVDTALYTVDTPRKKSTRVTVTIHLTPGKDDDLIRVVTAVPLGQRMNAVKGILRGVAASGGAAALIPQPKQMALPMPDYDRKLDRLVGKMEWMETVINDWPGYFENLIQQVATTPGKAAPPPTPKEPEERVADDILQQRSERAKKAKW